MTNPNLLTILTVRSSSERLPGKALIPIKSKTPDGFETQPLIVWIIRRLRKLDGSVVVATTNEDTDNELAKVCRGEGVEVIRGSKDDVIDRMDLVIRTGQYPGVTQVFRALGDMPYINAELVNYAARRLEETGKDAFVWALPPEVLPIYGSREFPYSLRAFRKIVKGSPFREHVDQYFHTNRKLFDVLYHLPPESYTFRNYRLEVDYQLDIDLCRVIAEWVGMLADVRDIIKFLDMNPRVARINAECIEKTGPLNLNTYTNSQRRSWLSLMQGQAIMDFSGEWVKPDEKKASPIFCNCGNLVGWGAFGRLYTRDGSIIDEGVPKCNECGLFVREWKRAKPRTAERF